MLRVRVRVILTRFGLKTVLLSRDHFLSFDSLLIRKMPLPWDLPHGFIIQVEFGFFLKNKVDEKAATGSRG